MPIAKKIKDRMIRVLLGNSTVPRGLVELNQYFRLHDPIQFSRTNLNDTILAKSTNFRHGSIIATGKNETELDKNIKDAILTSFSVPSSYAEEAHIVSSKDQAKGYALA